MKQLFITFALIAGVIPFAHADSIQGYVSAVTTELNKDTVLIELSYDDPVKDTCNFTGMYSLNTKAAGGANVYASVLSAQAANQKVKLYTSESACSGSDTIAVTGVSVGFSKQDTVNYKSKIEKIKNTAVPN
jgi:hypothetical protein